MREQRHPIQPVVVTPIGGACFKDNPIVCRLLDLTTAHLGFGMNQVALWKEGVTDDDRAQFAQLVGYSLRGYAELPYVSRKAAEAADQMYRSQVNGLPITEDEARLLAAREELAELRDLVRPLVEAFRE